MKLHSLIDFFESIAPLSWQEPWDKSGLQIGDPEQDLKRVLFALDLDGLALQRAIEAKVDAVVTHHPLFFKPLEGVRSFVPEEQLVRSLLFHNISVYSMHTNLDAAPWGVNDQLAHRLGLAGRLAAEPLIPVNIPADSLPIGNPFTKFEDYVGRPPGLGLVARVDLSRFDLLRICREGLAPAAQVNFGDNAPLKLVVLAGGSWDGAWLEAAVHREVDAIITGEMKYHDQIACRERGIAVFCLGHDVSERVILPFLQESLRSFAQKNGGESLELFVHEGIAHIEL